MIWACWRLWYELAYVVVLWNRSCCFEYGSPGDYIRYIYGLCFPLILFSFMGLAVHYYYINFCCEQLFVLWTNSELLWCMVYTMCEMLTQITSCTCKSSTSLYIYMSCKTCQIIVCVLYKVLLFTSSFCNNFGWHRRWWGKICELPSNFHPSFHHLQQSQLLTFECCCSYHWFFFDNLLFWQAYPP